MKTFIALLWVLILSLLAGCYSVPATRVSMNPSTHTLTIASPKDIEMTNVVVTVAPDKTVSINIGYYGAKNNPLVLKAINDANLETQKNMLTGLEKIATAAAGFK
jgi:hypothetical protein